MVKIQSALEISELHQQQMPFTYYFRRSGSLLFAEMQKRVDAPLHIMILKGLDMCGETMDGFLLLLIDVKEGL